MSVQVGEPRFDVPPRNDNDHRFLPTFFSALPACRTLDPIGIAELRSSGRQHRRRREETCSGDREWPSVPQGTSCVPIVPRIAFRLVVLRYGLSRALKFRCERNRRAKQSVSASSQSGTILALIASVWRWCPKARGRQRCLLSASCSRGPGHRHHGKTIFHWPPPYSRSSPGDGRPRRPAPRTLRSAAQPRPAKVALPRGRGSCPARR